MGFFSKVKCAYVITQNLIISVDSQPSLKAEGDLLVLAQGLCSVLALRPKNTVVKYITGSTFSPTCCKKHKT